ncbi:hypothetical protein SteCoe_27673 [Stentor coeruleus]|uniref:DRBM domain-containing protein n=1 Tax=Stentor coeruleus TaxID=5963 RepID=A0A1R2B9Z4_9CILI|nr:hypothetical protein SteCoe_27673 [Stentor coeruleus]
MTEDKVSKNPISILNEYCLGSEKTIDFTFEPKKGEFICNILYMGDIIATAQNKKKQIAKAKAAEQAINYLNIDIEVFLIQNKLKKLMENFKSKGSFHLVSNTPSFNYEYNLGKSFISSGTGETEKKAWESCAKSAIKVLKEFLRKRQYFTNLSEKRQVKGQENIRYKDPRVCILKGSLDQQLNQSIKKILQSFAINEQETLEIKTVDKEMKELAQCLEWEIYFLGSHSLGQVRKSKLEIDYALVLPEVHEHLVHDLFEICQKAHSAFTIGLEGFKLSSSLQLCENFINPYSMIPYIKMTRPSLVAFLYIYDNMNHPSLEHYKMYRPLNISQIKIKTSLLLRHWRYRFSVQIPVEILDLVVDNFICDDMNCGLALRVVMEKISSGIFLPGAKSLIRSKCHDDILKSWAIKNRCEVMGEAMKCLISLSQGEIEKYLE